MHESPRHRPLPVPEYCEKPSSLICAHLDPGINPGEESRKMTAGRRTAGQACGASRATASQSFFSGQRFAAGASMEKENLFRLVRTASVVPRRAGPDFLKPSSGG